MQILYRGQYRSVRMNDELEQKAQSRCLRNECLSCDTPLERLGACYECDAPFLIGIMASGDWLYVQRHTQEPLTLELYEKARETRQEYLCLSCDAKIDPNGL